MKKYANVALLSCQKIVGSLKAIKNGLLCIRTNLTNIDSDIAVSSM